MSLQQPNAYHLQKGMESLLAPPSSLSHEMVIDDPEIANTFFARALSDLEAMNTRPCGLYHEQTWTNGGRVLDICGPAIRENSLYCGHGIRRPMRDALDMLHTIGFIDDGEHQDLTTIVASPELGKADAAANLLSVVLQADSHKREGYYSEKVSKLGIEASLESLSEEDVKRHDMRLQVTAGKNVRALYKVLTSALLQMISPETISAENSLEAQRKIFRQELDSAYHGFQDKGMEA